MNNEELLQLLHSMTLQEKLGQMTQLTPDLFDIDGQFNVTGPLKELNLEEEDIAHMGSTLNGTGAQRVKRMQDKHMKEDRLHIPLLIMADVVHGYRTIFPVPHAMSCSFNPALPEKAASIAAREAAAAGVQVTFAPMADLVRDPRWGRVMESPGEDPYLNAKITEAYVRGFQGSDPKAEGKVAACVKHFAAYGASEAGRDYNTVDISEGILREFYLSAYQAAVKAGVKLVMSSFNLYERVPAAVNKKLQRQILRKEWGFDGVTITDYSAVDETLSHGVCQDGAEAARRAIEAGTDIEMTSCHFYQNAERLVAEGKLDEKLIDEAVYRILRLKNELGLFENPYKDADEEKEKELFLCPEHLEAARRIGGQCAILLKNENKVLPLSGGKIGLAGPFACVKDLLGPWALTSPDGVSSIYDAFCARMGMASLPCGMTDELPSLTTGIRDVPDQVEEALQALSGCDTVVVCIGENVADSGEAASKVSLRISPNQEKLVRRLKESGKTVIAVVLSGRPLVLTDILPHCDAVVQAWYLGTEMAKCVTDVLFGDVNPSARVALSFPRDVGQCPVYYNHYRTGRPLSGPDDPDFYKSRYLDCLNEPLFPFGYGLSYSEFSYSPITVTGGSQITAQVTVKNTSSRAGKETVQLYVHDVVGSIARPVKELKGFEQIELQPGEEKTVSFQVTKEALSFPNEDLELVFEPGEFDVMIGPDSAHVETVRVTVQ